MSDAATRAGHRESAAFSAGGLLTAPAVVAVAFALAAGWLALADVFADDEGHLSYIGAALMRRVPLDALFFQKLHPAASALYLPFVGWGWHAFLVWHVALAAAAVYMLGATARSLGGSGLVASLMVATSPLYFMGAAAGLSNTTGIFFLALACFVYRRKSRRAALLAGIVAALGLWSRYEQAPYFAGLLAYAVLVRRDWRFAFAFFATIGLYVGLGALYHESLLWLVERPPALVQEIGPSTLEAMGFGPENVREMLVRLMLLTPLYLAPLLLPPWRTQPVALRWIGALLLLSAGAQFVLPLLGGYFNYDHTARYFLVHLPALALLTSWAVVHLPVRKRARVGVGILVAGLACALYAGPGPWALLALVAFAVPLLLAPRTRPQALAVVALVVIFQVVPGTLYARSQTASVPNEAVSRLVERVRQEPSTHAVYTNAHQVERLLASAGDRRPVRFLPGYDIMLELAALMSPKQAERVLDALRPLLYGEALWPCEFPRPAEQGALLLLRLSDQRAEQVYDFDAWTRGARLLESVEGTSLWRIETPFVVPSVVPPQWMSRKDFCLPCPKNCSLP